MDYNKEYYRDHKEELKKKRRDRYYKNNERDKYKKTRTKIVLRNSINKIS
jgi:homoserine trans-succinylase